MSWHFLIILRNSTKTKEISVDFSAYSSTMNYFEAWNACVSKAKEVMDKQESPFDWHIRSISDVTAR